MQKREKGERHFTRACSNRQRGSNFAVKESRVQLDIMENILIKVVIKPVFAAVI